MLEVILREYVENLGGKNEVVRVRDGFARNYLFPKKLAILASPGSLKNLDTAIKSAQSMKAKRVTEARGLAAKIQDAAIRVVRKAGKEGKLYGSVTTTEVADLILGKTGITIDRRKIILPTQLKYTGVYNVMVKLEVGVNANVVLEVLSEEPKAPEVIEPETEAAGEPGVEPAVEEAARADEMTDEMGDEAEDPEDRGKKKKRRKHVNEAEMDLPE